MEKNNHYNEIEKSNKEKKDKELKKEFIKQLEFKKTKEKISIEIESEKLLANLKDLIEKWEISKDEIANFINNIELENEEIVNIFKKIEEIENIDNIDNILPRNLRVNEEEYKKALKDEVFRSELIIKINNWLSFLSNQIKTSSSSWLNLFWWYLFMLDKNLILVQENSIEIKTSLVKLNR